VKNITLILVMLLGTRAVAVGDRGEKLVHINVALKAWLQAIEADTPYLLVDRGMSELRLMHGKAVMRNVAVVADSLGRKPAATHALENRLRRYRPSSPWSELVASPFDWEQNLVVDATPMSALYFGGGLLVYTDAVWSRPGAVALQLGEDDLRALYNACVPGMELIVLPKGWKDGVGP